MRTSTPTLSALVGVAASIALLSGCSNVTDALGAQGLDDKHDYDAGKLEKAWDQLADEIGEKNPQVVSVTVTDTMVTVAATDPAARTELNDWTFSGTKVLPPVAVDYDGNVEGLKQSTFDMAGIEPATVASFVDAAVAKADIEKGAVQSVLVRRDLPTSKDIHMVASVQGERDSASVTGDADGKVLSVDE